MTHPLKAALSVLLLAGCATSAAPPPRAGDAACGKPIPITPGIVQHIARFATAPLAGDDAVLIGEIRGDGTVIAFVRRSGTWAGRLVAGNAKVGRIARASGGGTGAGDLFVWTAIGRGDPPTGFTGMFVPAVGGEGFCSGFAAPAALDRPDRRGEAFAATDFNIAASGVGAVIGRAAAIGGRQTYRYRTRDGGRHWRGPERVSAARPVPGRFRTIEAQSAALMADLRAAADRTLIAGERQHRR